MLVLIRLLRFILSHPLAGRRPLTSLIRLLRWQLGRRITGMPAFMTFVPPTRLLVHRGMSSATATLYAGLTDPAEIAFVMHLLRQVAEGELRHPCRDQCRADQRREEASSRGCRTDGFDDVRQAGSGGALATK